jgi:zinc/manganese transport system substrate-binding protein
MRTIIVLSLAVTGVAGCGSAGGGSTLHVVASTNVYGDITAQIGGAHVGVTSVLSDPNADPHLFEPGTQNGLAVAQAKVVIQNGAGYDDFMGRLESASPSSSRIVVTIADVLGVHGRDANPHLWYDVPRLPRIAGAIAAGLEKVDPKHAAAYRAGLDRFVKSLRPLDDEVLRIRTRYAGRPIAYTEPVPGYLVAALGLRNLAPASFTRAIQNGSEPPAEAVAAMNALIAGHHVDVLLYNSQAVSPITARVRAAAQQAGIPVVGVTETLPPHLTFQQWQLAQVRSLQRALAR